MLTLRDCVDMCDLAPELVETIAEHEGVPAIMAAQLGNCLVGSDSGLAVLHRIILDDLAQATGRGDYARRERARKSLERFRRTYPWMPQAS